MKYPSWTIIFNINSEDDLSDTNSEGKILIE